MAERRLLENRILDAPEPKETFEIKLNGVKIEEVHRRVVMPASRLWGCIQKRGVHEVSVREIKPRQRRLTHFR